MLRLRPRVRFSTGSATGSYKTEDRKKLDDFWKNEKKRITRLVEVELAKQRAREFYASSMTVMTGES